MAIRADDVDLCRDRVLVEAWQAGDLAAFDELYSTYFDRIRAYCERRVGSAAAEEVAQDTFVKALLALPRFSGERRFYPWLTVIASRLCIDHVRRHSRVQPTDRIDLGSVDDGHDARLSLQADLANLDQALGRLGPRHVEVLELRERRGLTYDEIAGQLGVPHSTVEALLFRARKALRREFQAVAGERLAAIPGVGWAVTRVLRARDRLALLGHDLGPIGGAIAAGTVAVALVALPGGSHTGPPATVTTTAAAPVHVSAPTTVAPVMPVAAPVTSDSILGPTPTSVRPAPTPAPRSASLTPTVRPTTGTVAKREATQMPIQLDLAQSGAALDPTPILDHLRATLGRNQ